MPKKRQTKSRRAQRAALHAEEDAPLRSGPVSIKDIARSLGISHSTVSRALRDSPLVRAETVSEIKAKAYSMGYRPSAVARSLVTRETRTIGVVVTTIADPFHGEVVTGIEESAAAAGYSVILASSHRDPEREIGVVRALQERRVDGILVASSRVGDLYLSLMTEMRVPIVLINNQHDGGPVYSVSVDNERAARQAVQHLLDLGHTRIAYLGDRFGSHSNAERLSGYQSALNAAGIAFDSLLVAEGDSSPEGSVPGVQALLGQNPRPTALFCYNDMSSLAALRVAAELGLSVPDDLSIVGFDDLFFAPYLQPPLTTIHQPRREMGREATAVLMALLQGKTVNSQRIAVEGKLIVRGSTAPPPSKPS
ncbi:MAG: LacI family DNA-binding transcriptional regulator [Bryobacteraceae bacterium]